jgi:hypothetical protein
MTTKTEQQTREETISRLEEIAKIHFLMMNRCNQGTAEYTAHNIQYNNAKYMADWYRQQGKEGNDDKGI